MIYLYGSMREWEFLLNLLAVCVFSMVGIAVLDWCYKFLLILPLSLVCRLILKLKR